jgi:hypothetical protein
MEYLFPTTFLLGKKNHLFEFGIGFSVICLNERNIDCWESGYDSNGNPIYYHFIGSENDYYSFFTPKFSYRFQNRFNNIFVRLSFTPAVAFINRLGPINETHFDKYFRYEYFKFAAFFPTRIFPWAGASIGYNF